VQKAGWGKGRAEVMGFGGEEASNKRLVLASCDPATIRLEAGSQAVSTRSGSNRREKRAGGMGARK